jgi:CheY-like chemotaxis protein
MQTGKLVLDIAAVDLRDVTSAALQALRPEAVLKGVRIDFAADVEAAPVQGDLVRTELGIAPNRLPALALTAYVREEDRRRALAAGIQAHIVKPFRITDIVDTIVELARDRGLSAGVSANAKTGLSLST